MSSESHFLYAARLVLEKFKRPMTVKELYNCALSEGYIPDNIGGRTPQQTMKSKLSTHILRKGDDSIFVRTAPGKFALRKLTSRTNVYTARRWRPSISSEVVTVVPSATFMNQSLHFQGIRVDYLDAYATLFESGICMPLARDAAEATEAFKQIITYVMVTRGDDFLSFRRGVYNSSPSMLRGSFCIGFGGHVNSNDFDLFAKDDAGIIRAAVRELSEELKLPALDMDRLERGRGLSIRGILNDDSSGVGRRHVAVVLEYQVSGDPAWDKPERGEKSITQLKWVGNQHGELKVDDYEYWSQLCLRTFAPELVRSQPAHKVRRRVPFRAPHLLCLVGEIGSGKTEAARALREEFGYVEVNTGRVVAKLVGIPPVPETERALFQEAARNFIAAPDGPERLALAISTEADALGHGRVLIDGIRQVETLRALRRVRPGSNLPVLYVLTSPDIAFQFYRSREAAGASMEEFLKVRDSEVEQEIPLFLPEADAVLYNWFGKTEFRDALVDLLKLA